MAPSDGAQDFAALQRAVTRLAWDIDALKVWREEVEEADPKLMRYELKTMNRKMDLLLRAIVTVGVGIVGSAIVFAFTVFALLGK